MKSSSDGHSLSTQHCPLPQLLGEFQTLRTFLPSDWDIQDLACEKVLVIVFDPHQVTTPSVVWPARSKEPSPISAEQEEGRDVSRALSTILDHLHVETVIVNCIVRDDHSPPTMLLHHSGLREEGAAPGRGGDEIKRKAGASCPTLTSSLGGRKDHRELVLRFISTQLKVDTS